jgi:hypothetical protein
MTPSLVGITATLPPLPTITQMFALTLSMVSGWREFRDHANHTPG